VDLRHLVNVAGEAMSRAGVPGCALGLLAGDHELTEGLGVTSVENPLDVDERTLFQIGSITKTFTGTLAMRFGEEGRLDLDAPVRTYLPDLSLSDEQAAAGATMRHLFTHTPGWVGDYFDDPGRGEDALARLVAQLADVPQLTPLGAVFSYNNAGFYIAGRVLEAVGGKPYEQLIAEHVLEPLELERTLFFAEDVLTHRFAVGHHASGGGTTVARPWALARAAAPAGGLNSCVGDLLRYARFHLEDEPGWLHRMREPQVEIREGEWVGITWMLTDLDGLRLAGHGGGTNGQISQLLLVPERGEALVVLTNADRGREVVAEVRRAFLGAHGLAEPELVAADTSPEQLAEYAGRYASALAEIDVRVEDGRLVEQFTMKGGFPRRDSPPLPAPPPVPLALYAADRAFVPEGPFKGERVEFLRDAHGRIVWLRDNVRLYARES